MSFVLPFVQLTEVRPAGALLPQAPADVPAFLFCSSKGTNFFPVQLGSQQQAAAEVLFGAGPWREGSYIAAKSPVQTTWCRVPATAVAASASAVDHSGVTGTAVSFVVGGTILDGYDVQVAWTIGGTFGTSATYKVSLDGGATYGTPIAQGASLTVQITGTLNGVSIATGVTVTVTTAQTVITNDVIKFWTLPPSASILPKTIARVASSTATMVPTGTPNDQYQVAVVFGTLQGTTGTVGTGGVNAITYQLALDGITFGPVVVLPLSGVIVIPDHTDVSGVTHQTGLTLTIGVGTVDPLDSITFNTTPPVPSYADLATAMDAIRNTANIVWSFFYVCGYSEAAKRNSVEAKLQTYAGTGRFTWASLEGRDRITGETVTSSAGNLAGDIAWGSRITGTGLDGWGSSTGDRTPPSFGSVRITDPNTSRRQRRPFAAQLVSQLLAYAPDVNPGQVSNGPLSADTSIVDANGQQAEHDGRVNPSIYAMGGNVIRTWEAEQGIAAGLWPGDGLLLSAAGEMTDITQRRVLNIADAALLVAMRIDILQKFGVAPSTAKAPLVAGNVFPWELKRLNQGLTRAVVARVGPLVANAAGGVFVSINPVPAPGPVLLVTLQLNGRQYIRGFKASAGFASPALFGIVTPAA